MHADTTNRITPEENWRLFCRDLRIKLPEKREADWAFRIKISRAEYDRRAKAGLLKPGMSYLIDEEPQPAFSRFKGWLRHRSLDRQIRSAEDNREHAKAMLVIAEDQLQHARDHYDQADWDLLKARQDMAENAGTFPIF
ncbi:hypothetical protein PARHAE_03279 [Paracoccus haematequi]|uniref:Uncharacterized protein n=1 Tax=Paracoccus haematequi TaxID=2491866 RepID=A0A447IRF8_9RHOB|nr:hypothetical protein [Paracoccus haematequi]VDS10068.1 hypothetical protein PARHAE_03279 [Paracoccus haematequi]